MKPGKENSEKARMTARRLGKVLGYIDENINYRDRNFLKESILELEQFADNGAYLTSLSPYQGSQKVVRKIIKNARATYNAGEESYVVNEKTVNSQGIRDLARIVLEEGSPNIEKSGIWFLGGSVANSPLSDVFSAKQILYLEKLQNYVEKVVKPHKEGKIFDKNVYKNLPTNSVDNFFRFATNGKFGGSVPMDYLEIVRDRWFSEENGLNSLRLALKDYVSGKKLKISPDKVEPAIRDLESFYRKNKN